MARTRSGAAAGSSKAKGTTAAVPAPVLRWAPVAVAFACVLVVYLVTWRGFFYYATLVQASVVCAAAAGLLAERWQESAAAAGAALVAGWLIVPPVSIALPPQSRSDLVGIAMFAVGGAVVAGLVWLAADRWGAQAVTAIVAVLVVVIVANLWATSLAVAATLPGSTGSAGQVTLVKWLESRSTPRTPWSDDQTYLEYYHRQRDGAGYYEAVRSSWMDNANWAQPPGSVFEVRPPALFWLWQVTAWAPSGILVGFLVFASAATVSAAAFARSIVKSPLAVIGAATVAAYFLFFATTTNVIETEVWGGAAAVVAVAALALAATRAGSWQWPFAIGVVVAVASGSMREMCLFVPLAGTISTVWAPVQRRRTQWMAWAGAWLALAVYWGIHFFNAVRIATGGGGGLGRWLRPGLDNVVSAMEFGTQMIAATQWLPWLLVAAGLAGVAALPGWQSRGLLLVAIAVPFAFFVVFRNDAISELGVPINLWGAVAAPVVYMCVPAAFAFVPGMRRPTLRPVGGTS